jgi:hypothetical protein
VAEPVHRLDLCTDCDGLRITEGTRFVVSDVTVSGPAGPLTMGCPAVITLMPLDLPPCPNGSEEAGRG